MRSVGIRARWLVAILLVLVCGVVVTACGSSGGSTTAPETETGAETTTDGGSEGSTGASAGLEEAEQLVAEHEAPQRFEAPGPPFDASKASGTSIYAIPISSELRDTEVTMNEEKEIAEKYGVKFTLLTNKGTPTEWAANMQQAINGGADVIQLWGQKPELVGTNNLVKAEKAGIKVIWTQSAVEGEPTPPHTWGVSPIPHLEEGKVIGSFVGVEAQKSGGESQILFLSESLTESAPDQEAETIKALKAACPGCEVTSNTLPFTDWATKLQAQISTELTKNPSIEWVMPIYDAAMPFVTPAVQQAHGDISVASTTAGTDALELLEKNSPPFFKADAGPTFLFSAWGNMDLILRALAGEEPYVNNENNWPVMLLTPENVKERLAEFTYKEEFEQLWSGE